MLSKYINENSWVLSVKNPIKKKHQHHFFCRCGREFMLQTEIDNPDAPDILCPTCGNDYFKDALSFEKMTNTKIWKYFDWNSLTCEDDNTWSVILKYEVPIENSASHKVKLISKDLLHVELKKDGTSTYKIDYKSKIISKYSLFLDDSVQTLKQLLVDDAKETLYSYIMLNKSKTIEWVDGKRLKEFSLDERLNYLRYFLKNSHLKEHNFFFWKMENIQHHTIKHTTELEMLDFICLNHKEKSIRKALYKAYENSLKHIGYYPYSDYIFSRTIENIDLLVKLYGIYPAIKQHLFSDETFEVGVEFILFLKRYYSEKQIVKLFIEDIQNAQKYKTRLLYWRDTLRMLYSVDAFISLEEHFTKVKLSAKKLHDEIIRVFHIVSYELDAKEVFEYSDIYLSACGLYEGLEFRLPLTVNELSIWAKILHNCMLGYTRRIHQKQSVIYGVFRANELLYAVELNGFKIVQAKAVFNARVTDGDMRVVDGWKNHSLIQTLT